MARPPRSRAALNPIQWFSLKADPGDPDSADLWLVDDPEFRTRYPGILQDVKRAGFDAVTLGVLSTQTRAEFEREVADAGLALAPGYTGVGLPPESVRPGSPEWVRHFDGVRRTASESRHFGLDTVFLAPAVEFGADAPRTEVAAAVGHAFDPRRLERMTEVLAEATELFAAEGVRAGLHNHVGTWVETAEEIDAVLAAVPGLGASFDVGHSAWAGIDSTDLVARYADRVIDLHVKDLDLTRAAASREHPTSYNWTVSRGLFQEPGRGDVDLEGVLDALPEDWDGWVIVEVDRTEIDPFDSARACAAWADRVLRPATA
jgi:inosose dehydratase